METINHKVIDHHLGQDVSRRIARLFSGHALALLLVCLPALVQAQPEEVVVIGTSPAKIETHVSSLMAVSREDQISRWNEPLCLRVAGLPEQFNAIVFERVSNAAEPVLISMADEGCNPNVMIFVAGDADAISKQVADHFDVRLRQAGPDRVKVFLNSDAPVRWISTFNPCGFGCRLSNSRLRASSAPSTDTMMIVVDATQIQQHEFKDVADYIAFVTLSNPSPDPSPALNSILGLFATADSSQRAGGLSLYDEIYLEALYSLPMDRFAQQQQSAISGRMLTRLSSAQE